MRTFLLCIFVVFSALATAQDEPWKFKMRALAVMDYFQTTEFVFRTEGIYEKNRCLRGASSVQTAMYLVAETEAAIWLIDRVPQKHRQVAGILATFWRAIPVVGNSKLGARHHYDIYVPLFSGRF